MSTRAEQHFAAVDERDRDHVVATAVPDVFDMPEDSTARPSAHDEELVLEDLLVEHVSIDGMCGVY